MSLLLLFPVVAVGEPSVPVYTPLLNDHPLNHFPLNGSAAAVLSIPFPEVASADEQSACSYITSASVVESLVAADAPSVTTVSTVACTEAAAAVDTQSVTVVFAATCNEAATAADTTSTTAVFQAACTETATAVDTSAAPSIFGVTCSESASAAEESRVGIEATVFEQLDASGMSGSFARAVFAASVNEAAIAVDQPDRELLFSASLSDTLAAVETTDIQRIVFADCAETASAVEYIGSLAVVSVFEQLDASGMSGSFARAVFAASADETAVATDTLIGSVPRFADITEVAVAVDAVDAWRGLQVSVVEAADAVDASVGEKAIRPISAVGFEPIYAEVISSGTVAVADYNQIYATVVSAGADAVAGVSVLLASIVNDGFIYATVVGVGVSIEVDNGELRMAA